MSTISFEAPLFKHDAIGEADPGALLTLPKDASEKLPSKGMTMVKGSINGFDFQAALEPNGEGSHWFKVSKTMLNGAGAKVGDTVTLIIEPTKEWPEPKVPTDLKEVLAADPEAHAIWTDITPMARWDWIRWVGAVKQQETRKRRVDSVCSRLSAGKRRPCCFDRTQCTLTDAWDD
jgi:hypothetical protein